MVKSLIMLSVIVSCMFLFIDNPMGIGMLLFILSVLMVLNVGFLISSWYAYMLFLVYVGGLLVMFIYICMISSNYRLNNNFSFNMFMFTFLMIFLASQCVINQKMITFSSVSTNGMNLPLMLFLIIGIYLLICFLAIINIIFSGGVSLHLESS